MTSPGHGETLVYKEDWPQAQKRIEAWWAREPIGRAAMAVQARRTNAPNESMPDRIRDPEKKWTNLEYFDRHRKWEFGQTFYGGEAFPTWNFGYPGRENVAVFLGCPVELGPDTGWVSPILTGEGIDVSGLKIDPENKWWKFTLKALEFGAERCRGKALLSIGAFGGAGDILAALRGPEQLLIDIIERPDEILAAEMKLMDVWIDVYRQFQEITAKGAYGTTCWFPLWSPGRFYAAQCDFAYMISPRDFRRLFMPAVVKQTEFLDHTVYHVDGEGNFAHVDALCEIPRLQALQILPGDGKPSPLHYMKILKKVQAAGKNLHITIRADEVETALSELSARGLFVNTSCKTEEEARTLLKNAEKWSRD